MEGRAWEALEIVWFLKEIVVGGGCPCSPCSMSNIDFIRIENWAQIFAFIDKNERPEGKAIRTQSQWLS